MCRVWFQYKPEINNVDEIKRFHCKRKEDATTFGCCSHVATVVSYLSYARRQPQIPRLTDQLTDIFEPVETGFSLCRNEPSQSHFDIRTRLRGMSATSSFSCTSGAECLNLLAFSTLTNCMLEAPDDRRGLFSQNCLRAGLIWGGNKGSLRGNANSLKTHSVWSRKSLQLHM